MLIATAGHVDHGKTALVKALTGVDTDRLAEEKRRGLSIDLGFAYQPLANGRVLGFIDVPGHQRFVHNMLAGVAAIDFALLVVAADDGVMPQTLEHLAILDLLGVSQGAVAITKCDRVAPARIAEVKHAVSVTLQPTALAGAPLFAVCAPHGSGIEALRCALHQRACTLAPKAADQGFRLAIDRCFSVTGAGLVVTGAVFSGKVQPGDKLCLAPAGGRVRVRGVHAQGAPAAAAYAGQRCALNITLLGAASERLRRGQWLVDSRALLVSDRIDVRLQLLARAAGPLKHWMPLHIHHGSADVSGRIALFSNKTVAPGGSGFAQLVLHQAVAVCWGDRIVLRDQSARHTLAGAVVVDPQGLRHDRKQRQRLALSEALLRADPLAALTQAVARSAAPFDLEGFVRARNLSVAGEQQLRTAAAAIAVAPAGTSMVVYKPLWHKLEEQINHAISDWCQRHAERSGPTIHQLRETVAPQWRPLLLSILTQKVVDGVLIKEGRCYRQPAQPVRLPVAEARVLQHLQRCMPPQILQPPGVVELAAQLQCPPAELERQLQQLAFKGFLRYIAKRYLWPATVAKLATIAADMGVAGQRFTVSEYRDRAAIGRNFAIAVLEYFDSRGLTRRLAEERMMVSTVNKIFD